MTTASAPTPRMRALLHDLIDIGCPEHPFRSIAYGPTHQKPSADFTSFIDQCIRDHLSSMYKDRLLEACAKSGLEVKPTAWKRSVLRLLAELPVEAQKRAEEFLAEFPLIVELPPQLAEGLNAFLDYASRLQMYFYALGFAVEQSH